MLSTLRRGARLHIQNSFVEHNNDQVEIPQITEITEIKTPEIAAEIKKIYKETGDLEKYKHNELRDALKHYKSTINFQKNSTISHRKYSATDQKKIKANFDFLLSGKKQDLIDRIIEFFKKENACINIQKIFRGKLVRDSIVLRGPGLKNKTMCVNDTDFYTFDKLKDIDVYDFFSYECDNFVYGFKLSSVITLFKNKTKKTLNPYTRTNMDYLLISIERLSKLTKIIHKNVPEEINDFVNDKITIRSGPPRTIYTRNAIQNIINQENTYNYNEMTNKLNQIRQLPLQTRIVQLFMEMDHLGNYTESFWFSNLDRTQHIRYYRVLYEIWSYRSHLPMETKNNICPLGNPFVNNAINMINNNYSQFDEVNIQNACICAMENMVYTGTSSEFKVLGAFQVLCALTIVSHPARMAMPWLYESVI
jgi:hypothetical protein